MSTTTGPGKRLYNFMVYDLKIVPADATAFFAKHGAVMKVVTALLTAPPGSFPRSPDAVAIKAQQHAIELQRCIVKHWDFLEVAKIDPIKMSRVTVTEWGIFDDGNPFVLVQHDVRAELLMRLPAAPVARRYGVALDLLLHTDASSLSRAYVTAEFTQRGLEFSDDFLAFDPSLGQSVLHALWVPGEETYFEASRRVPKTTYGKYSEFTRMRNRVVFDHKRGSYWLAEKKEAEEHTAGLIAAMVRGATQPPSQTPPAS